MLRSALRSARGGRGGRPADARRADAVRGRGCPALLATGGRLARWRSLVLTAAGGAIYLLVASALRSPELGQAASLLARSARSGAPHDPRSGRPRPTTRSLAGAPGRERRAATSCTTGPGPMSPPSTASRSAASSLEDDGAIVAIVGRPGPPAAARPQLLVRPARPGARLRRTVQAAERLRRHGHRPARGRADAASGHCREARAAYRARQPADVACSRRLAPIDAPRSRSARRALWSWPTTRRCWPASTRTRATPCVARSVRASP